MLIWKRCVLIVALLLSACGPAIPDFIPPEIKEATDQLNLETHVPEIGELAGDGLRHEIAQHIIPWYPDGYRLNKRWRPLRWIQEGFNNGDAVITIDDTIYVDNLNRLLSLQNTEEGIRKLEGILLHEREHAIRQRRMGVDLWILRYATDSDFRWEEEKVGWEISLRHWHRHNVTFYPERLALVLNEAYGGFRVAGIEIVGEMISYDEALRWIESLKLTPPEDDVQELLESFD